MKQCTSQGAKWLFPYEPLGMGRGASVSLSPQGTQHTMGERHPSHRSLSSCKAPKFGGKGCASSCRGHWELVLFAFWERSPGAGAALTCTPVPARPGAGGTWCDMGRALGLAGGKQGAMELLNVEKPPLRNQPALLCPCFSLCARVVMRCQLWKGSLVVYKPQPRHATHGLVSTVLNHQYHLKSPIIEPEHV